MKIMDGHMHLDCYDTWNMQADDISKATDAYNGVAEKEGIEKAVAVMYPESVGLFTPDELERMDRVYGRVDGKPSLYRQRQEHFEANKEHIQQELEKYVKLLRMDYAGFVFSDGEIRDLLKRAKPLGFAGLKFHNDGYGQKSLKIVRHALDLGMPLMQFHFLDKKRNLTADYEDNMFPVIINETAVSGGGVYLVHGAPTMLDFYGYAMPSERRYSTKDFAAAVENNFGSIWLGTTPGFKVHYKYADEKLDKFQGGRFMDRIVFETDFPFLEIEGEAQWLREQPSIDARKVLAENFNAFVNRRVK